MLLYLNMIVVAVCLVIALASQSPARAYRIKGDRPYWTDTSHSPDEQDEFWKKVAEKRAQLQAFEASLEIQQARQLILNMARRYKIELKEKYPEGDYKSTEMLLSELQDGFHAANKKEKP